MNEPASGLSGSNENTCTNVERMQLRGRHPSGKASFDNALGSSNGNQIKPAPARNASKDLGHNHKEEGIGFRHQHEIIIKEVKDATTSRAESETTHVIHSVLKLRNSIDEAPEHGTNI